MAFRVRDVFSTSLGVEENAAVPESVRFAPITLLADVENPLVLIRVTEPESVACTVGVNPDVPAKDAVAVTTLEPLGMNAVVPDKLTESVSVAWTLVV